MKLDYECCICLEKENFCGVITCKICNHSFVCLECYAKLQYERCPLCNSDYIDEQIRVIMWEFFHDNADSTQRSPLYQILHDNFRGTELYKNHMNGK